MEVISKSIEFLQSYRSLNTQNIARFNFKQWSFNALWEKLNLANVKNSLIYRPLVYSAFRLQKTKGSINPIRPGLFSRSLGPGGGGGGLRGPDAKNQS